MTVPVLSLCCDWCVQAAALEDSDYLKTKIRGILEGSEVDGILDRQLDGLMLKPEGEPAPVPT